MAAEHEPAEVIAWAAGEKCAEFLAGVHQTGRLRHWAAEMQTKTRRRLRVAVPTTVLAIAMLAVIGYKAVQSPSPCYPAKPTASPVSAPPGGTLTLSSVGGCAHNAAATTGTHVQVAYDGIVGGRVVPSPPGADLGPVDVDASGAFSAVITLPTNAPVGQTAELRVTGYPYQPCNGDCGPAATTVLVVAP